MRSSEVGAAMFPETIEELKLLLGENNIPKEQLELDAFLKFAQETVKRRGPGWLENNKSAFWRQWEYVAFVMF